jgi:hypothetical protein
MDSANTFTASIFEVTRIDQDNYSVLDLVSKAWMTLGIIVLKNLVETYYDKKDVEKIFLSLSVGKTVTLIPKEQGIYMDSIKAPTPYNMLGSMMSSQALEDIAEHGSLLPEKQPFRLFQQSPK